MHANRPSETLTRPPPPPPYALQHHVYRDPSPFASFAVHPVEAFFTFVPVLGMCRPEMPVWAHAYGIWVIAWALINLYLHSGAFKSTALCVSFATPQCSPVLPSLPSS